MVNWQQCNCGIIRYTSIALITLLATSSLFGQIPVAVVDLKSNDLSFSETSALTDRLITELYLTGKFVILERETLHDILKKQAPELVGCYTVKCLRNIGILAKVDQIIYGTISKVGSVYSISAKMISIQTGSITAIALFDYEGNAGILMKTGMAEVAKHLAVNTNQEHQRESKKSMKYKQKEKPKIKVKKESKHPAAIPAEQKDNKPGFFKRLFSKKGSSVVDFIEVEYTANVDTIKFQSRVKELRTKKVPKKIQLRENEVYAIGWVTIPAGPYAYGKEKTIRREINYDYQIMKCEVTNYQYMKFLTEALAAGKLTTVNQNTVTGYYSGDPHWSARNREYYDLDDGDNHIHWNGSKFIVDKGYENHPVVEVTWFGANAFAEFYGYRLPSDYAWEKAARGDTGYTFPWGDENPCCGVANFRTCNGGTIPVGQTNGISPYGVYDMAGNVWEWTRSYYDETTYVKVIRGGAWDGLSGNLRTYFRYVEEPPNSTRAIGFRCIRFPQK